MNRLSRVLDHFSVSSSQCGSNGSSDVSSWFRVKPEVAEALKNGKAVVALEVGFVVVVFLLV